MRIIAAIIFALAITKILSLFYFASKSKNVRSPSEILDDAGKVFLTEAINDEIIQEQRSETDEIFNALNSDRIDELLDEPVQYDDDTVDDDYQDDDQDLDQVNSDLVLKAEAETETDEKVDEKIDAKMDEKTTERELEQEKKAPEPVIPVVPVVSGEEKNAPVPTPASATATATAPVQNVKRLVEGVDFVREDGVIVATDANFQDLVRHFKYTFIDFYAEWCGWCRKLEPEFAKTAKLMKKLNPDVGFIKINLTKNKLIKKAYKIHRFPTVALFNRLTKQTVTFKYDRTPLVMAKWIQKTLKQQGSI